MITTELPGLGVATVSNLATDSDHGQGPQPAQPPQVLHVRRCVSAQDPQRLIDFLHHYSRLSRQQLKDAASKGAVRLKRRGKMQRVRRVTTELRVGDCLELRFDATILALTPPPARCLADLRQYSVWYKPAGMLAQGNAYGDHCALTRVAERAWSAPRKVWLVQRLDREAAGLMLLAHSATCAAQLSQLFQRQQIEKHYRVQVRGDIAGVLGRTGCLQQALDGKSARTQYQLLHWDPQRQLATLAVQISSGRLHQIRRHLAEAGFPVLGDPRYGQGNKDPAGLRLLAVGLAFPCPLRRQRVVYQLPEQEIGF